VLAFIPTPWMIPAIQVEHVVKRYGGLQALADVSLEIEQGEFFGVGDVSPWFSATIVAAALLALSSLAL
jgi:ABC-type transporter Mla maintaining outer membrane lipid asymmetry ATPase subunit MlaF